MVNFPPPVRFSNLRVAKVALRTRGIVDFSRFLKTFDSFLSSKDAQDPAKVSIMTKLVLDRAAQYRISQQDVNDLLAAFSTQAPSPAPLPVAPVQSAVAAVLEAPSSLPAACVQVPPAPIRAPAVPPLAAPSDDQVDYEVAKEAKPVSQAPQPVSAPAPDRVREGDGFPDDEFSAGETLVPDTLLGRVVPPPSVPPVATPPTPAAGVEFGYAPVAMPVASSVDTATVPNPRKTAEKVWSGKHWPAIRAAINSDFVAEVRTKDQDVADARRDFLERAVAFDAWLASFLRHAEKPLSAELFAQCASRRVQVDIFQAWLNSNSRESQDAPENSNATQVSSLFRRVVGAGTPDDVASAVAVAEAFLARFLNDNGGPLDSAVVSSKEKRDGSDKGPGTLANHLFSVMKELTGRSQGGVRAQELTNLDVRRAFIERFKGCENRTDDLATAWRFSKCVPAGTFNAFDLPLVLADALDALHDDIKGTKTSKGSTKITKTGSIKVLGFASFAGVQRDFAAKDARNTVKSLGAISFRSPSCSPLLPLPALVFAVADKMAAPHPTYLSAVRRLCEGLPAIPEGGAEIPKALDLRTWLELYDVKP